MGTHYSYMYNEHYVKSDYVKEGCIIFLLCCNFSNGLMYSWVDQFATNQSPYSLKKMVKNWKLQLLYTSYIDFLHIFSTSLMAHIKFLIL
jgi:hypothetical protein